MTRLQVLGIALFGVVSLAGAAESSRADRSITVASYYFGNYHPGDARNEKLKGKGWSEWELVKAAQPLFPGHQQPKIPLWGYTDEADPKVMAQKIAAAADHGVDVFIFDWYYYNDGPFLQDTVDRGYLRAPNRDRVKFALMWANHDWVDMHPYRGDAPPKLLYPGTVTPGNFRKITDHAIQAYFARPSYWRIGGKPYFSIYDLQNLVASFGSVKATRTALDEFRARAAKSGLPGLHLNAVAWGKPVTDNARLVHDLGFDSVTSYVWVHHVKFPSLQTDYEVVRDQYLEYWDKAKRTFAVPYIPNVTMGWDGTPRNYQGLGSPNMISGNTPERFREALRLTKERLLAQPQGPRILNINCWNEWTEGSYLEPDTVHGPQYLDAVREVFAKEN